MIVAAIVFGWSILLNGSTFAAMWGRQAQKLDLPGSALIPYVCWVNLAVYVLAVFAIQKFKVRWRWPWFVAVTLLCHLVIGYPVEVLQRGSVRIPVAASLNRESKQAFEMKYPGVKWVSYSMSSEGTCVRVGRDDYSLELAAFVTDLAAHQVKQGSRAGQ